MSNIEWSRTPLADKQICSAQFVVYSNHLSENVDNVCRQNKAADTSNIHTVWSHKGKGNGKAYKEPSYNPPIPNNASFKAAHHWADICLQMLVKFCFRCKKILCGLFHLHYQLEQCQSCMWRKSLNDSITVLSICYWASQKQYLDPRKTASKQS